MKIIAGPINCLFSDDSAQITSQLNKDGSRAVPLVVEVNGFEPMAFCVQGRCSPN